MFLGKSKQSFLKTVRSQTDFYDEVPITRNELKRSNFQKKFLNKYLRGSIENEFDHFYELNKQNKISIYFQNKVEKHK